MTTKNQTAKTHAELVSAGELLASSKTFGDINPSEGYVIASMCDQEGMSYLEFSETYNWMHASASMKADAMLARFCDMGGKYAVGDRTPDKARISVEFSGRNGEFQITWDDVKDEPFTKKASGTTKSNYATPRKRMQSLWSRAVSDAVHTTCPQACKGNYTTEEAESFDNDVPGHVRPSVPITPAEAADRAEAVEVEIVEPEADIDTTMPNTYDYTVSPIGGEGVKGKAWAEFTDAELAKAATIEHDALTHTHKAAIRFEIDKRKGATA